MIGHRTWPTNLAQRPIKKPFLLLNVRTISVKNLFVLKRCSSFFYKVIIQHRLIWLYYLKTSYLITTFSFLIKITKMWKTFVIIVFLLFYLRSKSLQNEKFLWLDKTVVILLYGFKNQNGEFPWLSKNFVCLFFWFTSFLTSKPKGQFSVPWQDICSLFFCLVYGYKIRNGNFLRLNNFVSCSFTSFLT